MLSVLTQITAFLNLSLGLNLPASHSFTVMGLASISRASFALLISFGAITGDSTLIIYGGATLAAVTTALAYRYRLATGVFKAVADADQYDAAVAVAATGLTLTAATFKNRTMVIDIDAAELADTKPYITAVVSSTATVLLMSALVVISADRYQPAVTNIV